MPLDLEKLVDDIEKIIKATLSDVLKSVDSLSNGLTKEIEKLVNKKFSIKNGSISKTTENAKDSIRDHLCQGAVRLFNNPVGVGVVIGHKHSFTRQAIITKVLDLVRSLGGFANRQRFGLL